LEWEGVLLSWAVPKGFSLDTQEKRLAVRTEDHPLEYLDFEAVIPEGNYGAGPMIVWDRGRWVPFENPVAGLARGKLLFELKGYKLNGVWTLFQTKKDPKQWLLMKKPDAWADPHPDPGFDESSVLSGLTVEELEEAPARDRAMLDELAQSGVPVLRIPPEKIDVMLAETVRRPFSRPGWLFELKYDGYRLLAIRDTARVMLKFRSGRDATRIFPEVARALAALPYPRFTIDGEVVVLDDSGRPKFQRLQLRAQRSRNADVQAALVEHPATLFGFDLLTYGDFDLRELSLYRRKQWLERILPARGPVRYAEHFEERGEELFDSVVKLGLEGIVAKKMSSPYRSGKRSGDWLKIPADRQACLLIVGYTTPAGNRAGFGALHLAGYRDGQLIYAGRVGTGFSDSDQRELMRTLSPMRRTDPPCAGPVPHALEHIWVEPRLVCAVRYKEYTEQGLLRQPSFLGLCDDVPASECLLPMDRETVIPIHVAPAPPRPVVRFTNLNKVLWPEERYTKGHLIEYYREISPWILPYLRSRFLVMDRYPDGISGKSFYQKNLPEPVPDWVRTEQVWVEGDTSGSTCLVCDDLETLLFVANLASIPLHIWASRLGSLDRPDWGILDLDPTEAPFQHVITVALAIRELAEACSLPVFVKTSGSKGLHILFPLGAAYHYEQARLLSELLARLTVRRLGGICTVDRRLADRTGKVYLDYLQNGHGKLLVAPFSVRPRPGATVSTPLRWEEVGPGLDLKDFTILSLPARMAEQGQDPMADVLRLKPDLGIVLAKLQEAIA
jgi:bifunctional non-homologous end joining protein LigD